ncbi:MAG: EscU/YscU/HrcU family type III secretion system export apparatus switch protein, partial [Clostridia bacterium]
MSANMREHAPSARRLQKARDEGKSWRSPDLQTGAGVVVGFGGLLAIGPWVLSRCFILVHQTLTSGWPTLRHGAPGGLWLGHAGLAALEAALPLPLAIMVMSVLVGISIHGFRIPGRFRFNTTALNPAAGIKRMVGGSAWVDLLRRVFTVLTLAAAAVAVLLSEGKTWLALAGVPAVSLPAEMAHLLWPVWFYT